MDFNQIKELINIFESSALSEMDIKLGESSVRLSKNHKFSQSAAASESSHMSELFAGQDFDMPVTIVPKQKQEVKEGVIVRSPMVGTFFASSAPSNPPYVKIGSTVKQGDVLCIVEAMKVMNEITSKEDGVIAEIFVGNGVMVEYDQPLFRIVNRS